jgi:predicted DNA binding protein
VAYFGGYYEQPRVSTGAELATHMGISKQAFHEHLRKAYATIFRELLETGGM